jgi:single-strand DNA-binding protein
MIIGNVGKDPEVRTSQSGTKIVSFSIATSEKWTDKTSGERQEKTEWHRIVVLGNDSIADVCERFLKKGSKVYIEGKIQTRKWVDNNGVDKYTTEIVIGRFDAKLVLLGDPGESRAPDRGEHRQAARSSDSYGSSRSTAPGHAAAKTSQWEPAGGDLDDDIPF